MKNILSKITKIGMIALIAMVGFSVSTQTAFAGYSMNSASNDCPTYMVVNATDNPQDANTACWPGTNITVGDGDTINLAVYFHNNGDAPAPNVSARVTDFRGNKSASTFSTIGQVYINGSAVDSGERSITLQQNSTITFVGAYVQTQSNRSWTALSNPTQIFNAGGINIGTVNPGWENQGVVKAVFKVVANTPTGSAPTIQNQQVSNVGTSSATINGTYSSNYSATKACFDVKYPNGDVVKRDANLPSGTTGNFSLNLSGLSAGTYYYQACGANVYGSASASGWESFTIGNSSQGNGPDVVTGGASVNGQGSVTLNGSFSNAEGSVTTCFIINPVNEEEVRIVSASYSGNSSSANFSKVLNGLSTGTYNYAACASDDNGDNEGVVRQFTITNNPQPPQNNISVATGSPSVNNTNGSATLQGNFYNNDGYVSTTYFIWRPINGSERATPSAGSYSNASHGFSYVQTGFANGTYEYRACANNGDVVCGEWVRFIIEKGTPPPISSDPTAQTLTPVSIGYTTAVIDGFYNMNGCSGRTYFEYGTSASSLGQATGSVTRSTSGSMAQALTGLTPGVTYYYRAVVENCNGTVKGTTYSFSTARKGTTTVKSTTSTGIVRTTVVREVTAPVANTVVTGAVGGARYVRLTIDNSRDTVARNEELVYDVAWENISNVDIKDLVLEITFPKALQITSTDRGQIDRDANAVYVNIDELRISEKDDITIRTKVVGNLKENDPVTARAIIAFENPENRQAQENAIAYDSDTFVASQNQVLGASIFGLGNLPGTLAGWLFLILLLILVILVIRYMTRREEHHHYYTNREDIPVAPKNVVTHEEVDYTPYRPTPKE